MAQRAIDIVAAALTTVLLAFGLFGSGLVVCMMPQTTQLLGNNFSGWNEATYPQDTMSELAEAVRSFSIDDTGRPQLEACVRTALEEHFPDIERTLAAGDTGQNAAGNLYAGSIGAGNLLSIYTLPASAVDHLEDCIPVFATSRIMIILSLVFAAAGIILLIVRRKRKLAGWIMFADPSCRDRDHRCARHLGVRRFRFAVRSTPHALLHGRQLDIPCRFAADHTLPRELLDGHGDRLGRSEHTRLPDRLGSSGAS